MKGRIWHNFNGKLYYIYVNEKNIDDVVKIITALSIRDLNDNNVDFNSIGYEVLDDKNNWTEWYDEDGLDINDFIEECYPRLFLEMNNKGDNNE